MNRKQIIGVVLIGLGLCFLGASGYIRSQVEEGNEQISSGQRAVDTTNSIFSLSPSTKNLGSSLTGGAQKKINKGKEEVAHYEALAGQLRILGYLSIFLGIIILALGLRKKR